MGRSQFEQVNQMLDAGNKLGRLPRNEHVNLEMFYDEVRILAAELRDMRLRRPSASPPVNSHDTILKLICSLRSLRTRFLPAHLFADPAWDMLLKLKRAEISQARVTVTTLCASSEVPSTTALRWIAVLMNNGMIVKSDDPLDGRRKFVELHPGTTAAMDSFLDEAYQEMHARSASRGRTIG